VVVVNVAAIPAAPLYFIKFLRFIGNLFLKMLFF